MAKITLTNQATPDTPASGTTEVYVDSTSKTIKSKDDAGTVSTYAASPLTTKGDIMVFDTADNRLAVGSNDEVLTADSAEAAGVKWATVYSDPLTTKGDIVVNNGSATTRLAVGSNDQVLTADSTEATGLKWAAAAGGGGPENPANTDWKVLKEEFMLRAGDSWNGQCGFEGLINGTGSAIAQVTNTETDRIGLFNMRSGTSAGAYVSACSNLSIIFGGAQHRYDMGLKMDNTPDGTDDYLEIIGYNNSTSTLGNNNCAFLVDRTVSTTNWVTSTEAGGTQTTNDSGVALDTSWHGFSIEVNGAGTSVTFSIDGSSIATHTTNIPTAAMHSGFIKRRVAGSSNRDTKLDWVTIAFKPTAARDSIATWISN